MSIPKLTRSQFNGEVFVSEFRDVYKLHKPPSVRLHPSHPFHTLWRTHLEGLSKTGDLFEGVVDCLAAIWIGDPKWKENTTPTAVSNSRSQICSLFLNTPPNLIILSGLRDYGCHIRCSNLWNYICVSNSYVNLWMEASKQEQKTGLAALLMTSIDHELAHWAQTIRNSLHNLPLSSYISNVTTTFDLLTDDLDNLNDEGSDSDSDDSDSDNASSPVDTPSNIAAASLQAVSPKAFQAPWMSGPAGEAGDFLEISTRGGIMEYDLLYKKVYFVVGENDTRYPNKTYLALYERNDGPSTSLIYHPSSQGTPLPSVINLKAQEKFPSDGVDACVLTRRVCRRNRRHVPTKVLKL